MNGYKRRFESRDQEWGTPDYLFSILHKEFGFTCDVAANSSNAKVENYIDEEQDALSLPWSGVCWLNPPYKQNGAWAKKALEESRNGAIVVMLIPARTNTNWWHEYCMKADEIRLIWGRPRFVGAKYGLPQPLAIVVFRGGEGPPRFSVLDIREREKEALCQPQ
jgi:phage N-6-adenine-methyltransferase